jgi:hypothetical protein
MTEQGLIDSRCLPTEMQYFDSSSQKGDGSPIPVQAQTLLILIPESRQNLYQEAGRRLRNRSFHVRWHLNNIKIFSSPIYSLLLSSIYCHKAELVDWVPVEGYFDSADHGIVAADSYSPVIG